MGYKNILLSLCGTTPAVITETVYCLLRKTTPQIIPDEIVAITTAKGKECILKELLCSGVWKNMLKELDVPKGKCVFANTSHNIRVIRTASKEFDAEDIISSEDNAAAGDFILDVLRQYVENPDTRVIFSVAGGRKTMSVLGALSMTLLGREQDKLCHVLLKSPLDNPCLEPRLFYPVSSLKKYKLHGNLLTVNDKDVTICDIPYPRNRYLFPEKYSRLPSGFMDTVNFINRSIDIKSRPRLKLIIDSSRNTFYMINDSEKCQMEKYKFSLLWFLVSRAKEGESKFFNLFTLTLEFNTFLEMLIKTDSLGDMDPPVFTDDRCRRMISDIRKELARHPMGNSIFPILKKGEYFIDLSPECIECPVP